MTSIEVAHYYFSSSVLFRYVGEQRLLGFDRRRRKYVYHCNVNIRCFDRSVLYRFFRESPYDFV